MHRICFGNNNALGEVKKMNDWEMNPKDNKDDKIENTNTTKNDDLTIHNTSEKKSFLTGKNIMIISVCAVFIISIIIVVFCAEAGGKQNKQINSSIATSNADSKEKTVDNTSSIKTATEYLPTTDEMVDSLKKYFSGKGIDFNDWVKSGTDGSIMQAPDGTGAIVVNSSNGFLTFSLEAQKDVILYDPNCSVSKTVCYIRSWSYDVYEILEVMLSGIPNELKPNTYELKASAENITTGYSPSIKKSGLEYKIGINNGKPVEILVTK